MAERIGKSKKVWPPRWYYVLGTVFVAMGLAWAVISHFWPKQSIERAGSLLSQEENYTALIPKDNATLNASNGGLARDSMPRMPMQKRAEGQTSNSNDQVPLFIAFPHRDGTIADFCGAASHRPLNNFGEAFNIISDAEWDGTSSCRYTGRPEPGTDGKPGFLRLEYNLKPNKQVESIPGYGGIWTDFSFPPPTQYDISNFSRLSMDLRLKPSSPKPMIFVALAGGDVVKSAGNVGYYDWDEIAVPPNHINRTWSHVELKLDQFKSPEWSNRVHTLDVHKVFRLIISVKAEVGKSLNGYLDIDNIRLIR
jgi:hypothetical protein